MKIINIVLNYNDYETTKKYLEYTKNHSNIEHIVIVDNASTDGSYDILKKYQSEKISVIQSNLNRGYATGNNYGIEYAVKNLSPDIICISNPDIVIENKIFDEIKLFLMTHDKVGIVSGRIRNENGKELLSAWKLPEFSDCVLEQLYVLKKLFSQSNTKQQNSSVTPVDVLPGCFFCIKTEVFKDIGFFDESTFLYYEENIISLKLKKKGYQNYLLNNITYIHKEHISIEKSYPAWSKRVKIAFQSRMIYCKKYLQVNKIQIIWLVLTYFWGLIEYKAYMILKGKKNEYKRN